MVPAGGPAVSTTLTRGLSPLREVLDNGAAVLVQETSTAPAVTLSASFLSGSVYDPDDGPGLAHLTGKVLDRGTERRSAAAIAEAVEDRGAALKVSTSRHTMTVTATCLAEDFSDVLTIVADVVRQPTFPEGQVAIRRAKAITALRQDEDNPSARASEGVLSLLYGPRHPYGRPAKGTVASVDAFTRAEVAAFHAAHVRPAVLSLVIVGDIPPSLVFRLADAEFGGWQPAAGPSHGTGIIPPPAPSSAGRRLVEIGMPGKSQTDIAYGFTTIARTDPRYYAYWMMNTILGEFGLGGRLADNIRERQGMAYYAFSTFDPAAGEAPLIVRAGVDPHNVARALDAIDAEVLELGLTGPNAVEVEETRQFLIGSIPRMFETNGSIAAFLQTVEHFGLGLDYERRLPALLEAVTRKDVAAAAAEVLHPDRAAVAIAGPSAELERARP